MISANDLYSNEIKSNFLLSFVSPRAVKLPSEHHHCYISLVHLCYTKYIQCKTHHSHCNLPHIFHNCWGNIIYPVYQVRNHGVILDSSILLSFYSILLPRVIKVVFKTFLTSNPTGWTYCWSNSSSLFCGLHIFMFSSVFIKTLTLRFS